MKKDGEIAFEESSGNVFADLGLDDADELLTRAKLGHSVRHDPCEEKAQATRNRETLRNKTARGFEPDERALYVVFS